NFVVLSAILFGLAIGSWDFYTRSPEYLAGQKLAEADQQAAAGELGRAAQLYGEVARTWPKYAPTANERIQALIDGPVQAAPAAEAAAVLKVGVPFKQASSSSLGDLLDSGF